MWLFRPLPMNVSIHQHEEEGREDDHQDRGRHHAPQHARADGILGPRPGAGRQGQGQDAESEGQ